MILIPKMPLHNCSPFTSIFLSKMVKNLPANTGVTGDIGLIPGLGRFCRVGNSNPLQYSCLENFMDRGAWQATVHRVTKSRTWLKRQHTSTHGIKKVSGAHIFSQRATQSIHRTRYSVQGLPGLELTSQASSKLGEFCVEGWPGKGRDRKEMASAPTH